MVSKKAQTTKEIKSFAVIETGGKQYKVYPGQTLMIEKLPGNLEAGKKVSFDKVLLVEDGGSVGVGKPYVSGASVKASVVENGKRKKIVVVKYKAKSRYFKTRGHRQPFTKVLIESI